MNNYQEIINNQMMWLSNLIFSNGEFVMHNSPSNGLYRIVPYFSNIAALSLLDDVAYHGKIKKYLEWYVSNINTPDKFNVYGTIYDYNLDLSGNLISSNDYDSYDSYPATFFTLCREYFEKTNNKSFFIDNKPSIDMIINSLFKSFDSDYLTYAKPNYKVKYLMDNCEVYLGLIDAAYIYDVVYNDKDMTKNLYSYIQKNFDAIQTKMYCNDKDYYYYMISWFHKRHKPNQKKWYPDATSQLFPILYRVIDKNSMIAKNIYNTFNLNQPNWYNEKNPADFPNTYVGYVAMLMNDYERVSKFIAHCIDKYINNDNKWPWNCFESGYFIRMLRLYLQKN